MSLAADLAEWFWRLLPANPIVVRVVAAGGRRTRHLWARIAYLAILSVVMLFSIGNLLQANLSLVELAKNSTRMFMAVSLVQLTLMSLIAPVFAAGAITQERDGNTFDILLTTPLSNAQIVLGSLLSRLCFTWLLLLSGLPIFGIIMIYGGVTTYEVVQSLLLSACTGLLAGAIAILISMLRLGTRRTLFAFFLSIALYLLGIGALGAAGIGAIPEASPGTGGWFAGQRMSWLATIHPFLALFAVTGQTPVPSFEDVQHYGWPWGWLAAHPAQGYELLTTLVAVVLVVISLIFVRRGAKEGERQWFSVLRAAFGRPAGERTRRPRHVWGNPIAWREAVTRGTPLGRALIRFGFIAGGLAIGLVMLYGYQHGWFAPPAGAAQPYGQTEANLRLWLVPIVWIELAIILLVVTNTAAGTLTRERESQTMEILLSTPLTSHYIVAGMLQGLVRFALPLVAVPTGTVLIFVLANLLRATGGAELVAPEAVLLLPLLIIAYTATAAMVGLQFSLTARKTVQAVMYSTTIVLGLAGLLTACGMAVAGAGGTAAGFVLPFTPFPAMKVVLDPGAYVGARFSSYGVPDDIRAIRAFMSLISAGAYCAITYSLYRNMVRSFDMTVRKQAL
jgi:ABC-type transport system involved in multi-copper enzyme maturation permease subunit